MPHGHWKTLTFIAALRFDGMTAPYVIDGAMDGPTFIAYVERVLTPTLKKGNIVFMDNLRSHKVDGVRQAIEAVGASSRYLPAYSPDLNPIEQAFSKLKTAMRKGAARTVKALWKLIGRLTKHLRQSSASITFDMPAMDVGPHQAENALARGSANSRARSCGLAIPLCPAPLTYALEYSGQPASKRSGPNMCVPRPGGRSFGSCDDSGFSR